MARFEKEPNTISRTEEKQEYTEIVSRKIIKQTI